MKNYSGLESLPPLEVKRLEEILDNHLKSGPGPFTEGVLNGRFAKGMPGLLSQIQIRRNRVGASEQDQPSVESGGEE